MGACTLGKGADSGVAIDFDGDGYISTVDCNDQDAEVHPDAAEICDSIDNDCDGSIDMEDPDIEDYGTWFVDVDGDGYGTADQFADACSQPEDTADNALDCNDRDDDVHPEANEECDGIDNDCDGLVDIEDDGVIGEDVYFIDADGDGFGTGDGIASCESVEGASTVDGDCDDEDETVYPGAPDECEDGKDSDCDLEDPECEED